jgi:hypothetical protein
MTVASGIRRRAPAMLASCLALMLAACALFQPPPPPPLPPPAAPEASERLPPPPRRKPRPPTVVARLAAPGAEGERVGLDRLIGLDQPQVADMLGEPESRAEAPPATIWRYAGAGCEVDVYFYLDLQSQAMRALHYEVRSHDPPERSQQRCYDALRSERRAHGDDASGSDRPR